MKSGELSNIIPKLILIPFYKCAICSRMFHTHTSSTRPRLPPTSLTFFHSPLTACTRLGAPWQSSTELFWGGRGKRTVSWKSYKNSTKKTRISFCQRPYSSFPNHIGSSFITKDSVQDHMFLQWSCFSNIFQSRTVWKILLIPWLTWAWYFKKLQDSHFIEYPLICVYLILSSW